MSRPTLIPDTVTPGQAGWDATINNALAQIKAFIDEQNKVYTVGAGADQLPAANTRDNCIRIVSDPASGKGQIVYSDGADWRYATDASVV